MTKQFEIGNTYSDTNGDNWKVVSRSKKYIHVLSSEFNSPTKKKIKHDKFCNELIEFNCRYPFNISAKQ